MNEIKRIEYAIERVMNASVITLSRQDWENLVNSEPTKINLAPKEMKGFFLPASLVSVVGSGIYNPSPGLDVVRYDPTDSPYVYNIDHYRVLEQFSKDPNYQRVVSMAGVKDSDILQATFLENVFIVGPYHIDNHWCEEIPKAIKKAKPKASE